MSATPTSNIKSNQNMYTKNLDIKYKLNPKFMSRNSITFLEIYLNNDIINDFCSLIIFDNPIKACFSKKYSWV